MTLDSTKNISPVWFRPLLAAAIVFAGCGTDELDLQRDFDARDQQSSSEAELNSSIYDRARAYAQAHPRRDGASWNQWCGSLMWRFGNLPASSARPSAIAAYRASSIVSTDASRALTGAFHWRWTGRPSR